MKNGWAKSGLNSCFGERGVKLRAGAPVDGRGGQFALAIKDEGVGMSAWKGTIWQGGASGEKEGGGGEAECRDLGWT